MATGGIFQLITNDGRQDRMLMATALLNSRLAQVRALKGAAGPTLADIEKTHIIFTNAHFKPFAAIGYEYNKVKASAGNPQLGSEIQFSIPQFGDFFHDMVLHVKLRQPVLDQTATLDGDKPRMRWCAYPGERLVKKCQFEVNGNPLDEYTSHAYNFYREFQVPPHKRVGWERCVGQEQAHRGYVDQPDHAGSGVLPTAADHRFGATVYDGNQTPSGQKSVEEAGDLELFVPLLFWCNKDPRLSIPSVAIPYGQRFINVTLADQEDLVNMVVRGNSTPTVPGGSISTSTNLVRTCELYINNIFVNPEVHDIFIKRIGFNLIRVHRQQVHNADKESDEVLLQQLKWPIESLFVGMKVAAYNATTAAERYDHLDKWHTFAQVTNTGFTEDGYQVDQVSALTGTSVALAPRVLDLATSITFANGATTMIGVGTAFDTELAAGDVLVVDSLGSAELTTVVVASVTNATNVVLSANFAGTTGAAVSVTFDNAQSTVTGVATLLSTELSAGDTLLVDSVPYKVLTAAGALAAVVEGSASVAATTSFSKLAKVEKAATVAKCVRTLDVVTIKAHGIPIYNAFPAAFYNAYIPFHYGGPNIQTPDDCGALMITFNLYPGTYQPSGHINISRAREFYLEYTSSVIGTNNVTGSLIVIASAINFLLISDGSAVLRYST